jgi:hypothetical protein
VGGLPRSFWKPSVGREIKYIGLFEDKVPVLTDLAVQLSQGLMRHQAKRNAGFSRQPLPNEFGVPMSARIGGQRTPRLAPLNPPNGWPASGTPVHGEFPRFENRASKP